VGFVFGVGFFCLVFFFFFFAVNCINLLKELSSHQ